MFLATLSFARYYAVPFPYGDDWWGFVDVFTGKQPLTLDWLWMLHNNQHRNALAKLVMWLLYHLTGNFRAGAVLNVGAAGLMAAELVWAARQLRGWTSYADAFFPLVLLNWGHAENFTWSWQFTFLLPVLVLITWLVVVVRRREVLPPRAALLAGALLIAFGLCGPSTVAYLPAVGSGFVFWGFLQRRSKLPDIRQAGYLLIASGFMALLLVPLYMWGMGSHYVANCAADDWWTAATGAVKFLSVGFGPYAPGAEIVWEKISLVPLWIVLGVGVLGLALVSCTNLVRAWYREPADRLRVFFLFCFLVGAGLLACAMGKGRGGPNGGIIGGSRYSIFAVPFLCGLFLAAHYGPRLFGRAVQWTLLVLVLLAFPLNQWLGHGYGIWFRGEWEACLRDLEAGIPASIVCEHWGAKNFLGYPYQFADLRQKGLRAFLDVSEEAYHEVTIPVSEVRDAVLTLPQPRFVFGVRLKFKVNNQLEGPCHVGLSWRVDDQDEWASGQADVDLTLEVGPEEQTLTFCVNANAAQFAVKQSGDRANFLLTGVTLLEPGAADSE
jgi:hypothetical protein